MFTTTGLALPAFSNTETFVKVIRNTKTCILWSKCLTCVFQVHLLEQKDGVGFMNKKTRVMIGLIGSLMICLFGVYRLIIETSSTDSLLIVPIAFAVTGFIGVMGNLIALKSELTK